MSRESPGRDNTQQRAKPVPHKATNRCCKAEYEHGDITDNRMLWEVLEEGESNE